MSAKTRKLDSSSENQTPYQRWVDQEVRRVDLVDSWEQLNDIYDSLKFIDPITDAIKMTEFDWIIKQTNKFLTKARLALLTFKDPEQAIAWLHNNFEETQEINSRQTLAWAKLRQTWILHAVAELNQLIQDETERAWEAQYQNMSYDEEY